MSSAAGGNGTMAGGLGDDRAGAFELSSPPMIGLLPATTVVYMLLAFGALLPVVLLSVVAVTLCVRRRSHGGRGGGSSASPSDATPVDDAATGHGNAAAQFDFDLDVDDVFWAETWKPPTPRRERTPEPARRKAQIHSADNPNVYFRNRVIARTQSDAAAGASPVSPSFSASSPSTSCCSSSDDVVDRSETLSATSSSCCRTCRDPRTPPPSCDVMPARCSDVTMTSSGGAVSRTSRDVVTAQAAGPAVDARVATLDRVQSTTKSALQQEEEQVLRLETELQVSVVADRPARRAASGA